MLKKLTTLFLVTLLCISLGTSAFAQDMAEDATQEAVKNLTAEELLTLIPNPDANLSRGDFSVMLSFAANLAEKEVADREELPQDLDKEADYAKAVMALLDEGIMKGTSQNTVDPEGSVTGYQALVLTARTLGIAEGAELHTLLVKEGIAEESMDLSGAVTAEAAAKLLVRAFGTDREAKALMEEVNAKNSKTKSVKLKADMTIKMTMTGVPELDGQPLEMKATTESAVSMDSSAMHQIIEMDMSALDANAGVMKMEQYMDKEYVYTSIPEGGWMKMENPMPMVFDEEFMVKQLEVSRGLDDLIYYRMLGKEEVEGKEAYKIAFYSRIDDIGKIYENLGAALDADTLKALADSSDLIDFMNMRGVQWVGVEDGLVYKADMDISMAMKGEGDEAIAMEMTMKAIYYDYNVDIDIVIPEEAKDGKTLEELMQEAEKKLETPAE